MHEQLDSTIYTNGCKNIQIVAEQLGLQSAGNELLCPNKGPRFAFLSSAPVLRVGRYFAQSNLLDDELRLLNSGQDKLPSVIRNVLLDRYLLSRQALFVPTLGTSYQNLHIGAARGYAPSEDYILGVIAGNDINTYALPNKIGTLERAAGNKFYPKGILVNAPQDIYVIAAPVKYGHGGEMVTALQQVTPSSKAPYAIITNNSYAPGTGYGHIIHTRLIPIPINPGDGSLPQSSMEMVAGLLQSNV